ncbi:MAG TPA: type VI secretion system baseplate subunit TssE [Acidocella sp.]|jgi:type VI secretion system protein ImpF|nr:type VI secretion system baseplate subunit TssE [Acidocella sp.]
MSESTLSHGQSSYLERARDAGARVKLSVLDRLLDDAPEMERDRPLSAGDALAVLRRAVRRDLEALLNARRRFFSIPRHFTELANSSFAFGLPDYSSGAMADASQREVLRREIERCIKLYEPRLAQVSVQLVKRKDDLDTTLQLRIEAMLHADPAPEPISFDTLVNATTSEIEVSGGAIG